MDVSAYMEKHRLTNSALDDIASSYESGDYDSSDGTVYSGSHLNAVGKRRVTVIYSASDTQKVASLAKSRGVKPSKIYRDALDYYLAAQA